MDYRLEALRYQLQEDPTSRVFFQLGELLRKEGQLEEAVHVLEAGLEHHPRYVAAWVSLGRARHDLGTHERAEAAFAHALEIDPENQVAARLIGEAAIARGDFVRAVKALKLARALSPRDPDLDERIAWVEEHLAGSAAPEPAGPEPTPTPSPAAADGDEEDVFLDADAPADGPEAAGGDRDWPTEPDFQPPDLEAGPPERSPFPEAGPFTGPAAKPPRGPAAAPSPARPRVVLTVSGEDPFAMEPSADTGVWIVADDVFGAPAVEPPVGLAAADDDAPFGDDSARRAWSTPEDVDLVEPPSVAEGSVAFADEPFGAASESSDVAPETVEESGPFEVEPPAPPEAPVPATTQRLLLSELPLPDAPPPPRSGGLGEGGSPPQGHASDLADDDIFPYGDRTITLPPRAGEIGDDPTAEPVPSAPEEIPLAVDLGPESVVGERAASAPLPGEEDLEAIDEDLFVDTDDMNSLGSDVQEGGVAPPSTASPRLRLPDLEPLELGPEEPEPDEPLAEEVPLPTLTLARLALAQGDVDLAQRTVESLLRHHPESTEALRLLAEVTARRTQQIPPAEDKRSPAAARIAALQGWLEGIRLAAERRTR